MRQPFFRKQTQSWYFKDDAGKFVSLGKDREAAFREFFKRMASRADVKPETIVSVILDKFLEWCKTHKASSTADWYANYLESFREFEPKTGGGKLGSLPLSALKPFHVTEWIDASYGGQDNSEFSAARSILRAFNWAVKEGHIEQNPIRSINKKRPEPREVYITAEQWEKVLGRYKPDDPFVDFLLILRETGCRPQEARAVEARHFDREAETWAFPVKESKGKKSKRIVPLNNRALEITRRLALKYPDGPLFRNRSGNRWTRHAIGCRFKRLRKRLGITAFAYAIRHTFVTDALLRGVDPVTLAHIMGHKDATMILRVYQHLNLNTGHIRKALAIATGETTQAVKTATA